MTSAEQAQPVSSHYGRAGLGDAILAGLRAAGKNPDAPAIEDLAPVDQFHLRGREATLELAGMAGLQGNPRVLDIGGGLGGAARTLATRFGCRVTVLDLTEEYCTVGEMLTARTGLSDRVAFCHGSALELPFEDSSFDAVWTQHSSMNIENKERLYAEVRRVLRPNGRLALHEIMAGPVQPLHYPVLWASDASFSFLRPAAAVRELISRTGFRDVAWVDMSDQTRESLQGAPPSSIARMAPPPLGLHLLLGENVGAAFAGIRRNLHEHRAVVIEAVFERA